MAKRLHFNFKGGKLQNSRTAKTAKNALFGLVSQIINIIISFVSRTVFIYVLGVEYLGVNGLFTNILMLLSFAELGIGNAIIYSMYKPIATKDKEKLKSLMALYAKAYKVIGLFVIVAGLMIIPFMDYIIKDAPNIKENINLIYVLFLVNTSLSYFFVYKKSIIIADQKNYIVLFYQQVFKIAQTVGQIAFLLLTGEYIIFLILQIIFTLLDNIYVSKKADKMYPFLCEGKIQPLKKEESATIFSNVKALFLYKFGSVVLNGTDNVIISAIIGITAVGLNSNYVLIISAITAIGGQIMNGFTASVGNLNAVGNKESKERVFNKIFFVSAWMYGFCAIGLFLFLNKLIVLWLDESFIFSEIIVFSIVLHFYVNSVHFTAYTYRVTMGLFVQGRWAPLAAAILNIVLSLWLGKLYGLAGIFFATSIARFFTTGVVDPILVYRNGFGKNPITYYTKYFFFLGLFIVLYFLMKYVITFIHLTGVLGFLIEILTVSILFNAIMVLLFWRSRDFTEIKNSLLNIARSKI
jgi:O-antigen/teichoic acid export membrane protein